MGSNFHSFPQLFRIAQLMLLTVPSVKQEFDFHLKFEKWINMLNNAVRLSPPPPEPAPTVPQQSHASAPIPEAEVPLSTGNPPES